VKTPNAQRPTPNAQRPTPNAQLADPAEVEEVNFPIVGIGASAGGLKAFEAFFSGMPADTDPGMAFVLVQHLAPDHTSILCELLQRYTRMKVIEVTDGIAVEVNSVYIIPPAHDMAFFNGTLHLLEPSLPRGCRLPIVFFFRSLANDLHERAIGIVLSGTGSDGTLGVRSIKGEGGMVMAQTPESTEFDCMPRVALETGMVDYELAPAEMPAQLIAYVTHAFGKLSANVEGRKSESALKKIFLLLRTQTSHDFSQYKPSTIQRRIDRRMAVHQMDSMDRYVKFLQGAPFEVEALFRDMLIGVTNFFRDPEAFHVLETKVIPDLFEGKPVGAEIRVWAAGCSTGEEAYSLAILLAERMEALKRRYKVQVFASDIDGLAIAKARSGVYPASIAADITHDRLSRYFVPEGGNFRVHKNIRDMVIFSEVDLIKDPPFSRLDLISCRNLLIYLGAELQQKIIPMFHYALKPKGRLFLGTSESVGDFGDLFVSLDRKNKLYQRKEDIYDRQRLALNRISPPMQAVEKTDTPFKTTAKQPMRELAEKELLQHTTAGALVNANGDILYVHGRAGIYLEITAGEAGINNILKLAREGLAFDLTMALHKAASTREIVHRPGVRIKTNGHFTTVNLTVRPLPSSESLLYMVVLEEVPEPVLPESAPATADSDKCIAELKAELRAREEFLRNSHEELETSAEELRSSNEEMQSVNEELQSTNEELETSQEELQSVNEELLTVNTELETNVRELSRANNDISNLLSGTGIATIFVTTQQRILSYTPAAAEIIGLLPADVGRPLAIFVSNLKGYDSIASDVESVLDSLVPKEVEVESTNGRFYILRIQLYRTRDHAIEGAAISFLDITELRKAHVKITDMQVVEEALRKSEERFKSLFVEAPLGIALIDSLSGQICEVNPMFAKIAGRTQAEMTSIDWMSITHPDDVQKDLDQMALFNAGKISGFQMEKRYLRPDGSAVWINMTIAPVKVEEPASPRHLCMIEDITEHKKAEDALKKANDQLRLAVVVRDAHDAITVQDLEGRIIAWNHGAVRMFGWSEADALAMNVSDRIPQELREGAQKTLAQLSQAEILEPYHTRRLTKSGAVVEVSIISTALINEAGDMYAIATTERALSGENQ